MTLTDRQKEILDGIVEEYIRLARPISSQFLEEEYDFGFSPATIRNEMLSLSEQGFLEKPYLSSGRVPTDQGYRFFVDEILQEGNGQQEAFEWESPLELARRLNSFTSALATLYLPSQNIVLKEGWESVLEEPEFSNPFASRSFAKFIKDFEEYVPEIPSGFAMNIFIGKENPFSKMEDFSIMIAECDIGGTKGFVALAGPKRMAYKKNIKALKSVKHGRRKIH
ncbi:MAG: hypothetical protein HYS52_01380 [Candidatus Wildermuthbacteria bacterium]|nr:hypothetical protein [Candidatus Wildermuthbacteria bacterium]